MRQAVPAREDPATGVMVSTRLRTRRQFKADWAYFFLVRKYDSVDDGYDYLFQKYGKGSIFPIMVVINDDIYCIVYTNGRIERLIKEDGFKILKI